MPDPKSKARVERLVHGDFHTEDLSQLFLYARDHCDGRESVVDIGDFIAHHSERDRGIITRSTQEWFVVARFHMSRLRPDGVHPFDVTRMPAATQDYFKIAVSHMDAKDIREKSKLRRAKAYEIMQDIVSRLVRNSDGTWKLPPLTKTERDLVQCVSSMMMVKPAFSAARLYDDFIATLKSNGLISKEDERSHRDMLRAVVQLYAVAAMHHCIVQVGDELSPNLGDDGIRRQRFELAI
jgi:hypothetical protein